MRRSSTPSFISHVPVQRRAVARRAGHEANHGVVALRAQGVGRRAEEEA